MGPDVLVAHRRFIPAAGLRRDRHTKRAAKYAAADGVEMHLRTTKDAAPVACDLLLIDHDHRAAALRAKLDNWSEHVSRYIVIHDTQTHGELGTDGGPGLLAACRQFMRDNPEWSVIEHHDNQHGLTVLGRRDEDKPSLPPAAKMAGNLGKALVGFVADGAKTVNADQLEERLLVCSTCPQRRNTRCAVCGCYLQAKAKVKASPCPLGYWQEIDDKHAGEK